MVLRGWRHLHLDHQIFQRNRQIAHTAQNIHAHFNRLLIAHGFLLCSNHSSEVLAKPGHSIFFPQKMLE